MKKNCTFTVQIIHILYLHKCFSNYKNTRSSNRYTTLLLGPCRAGTFTSPSPSHPSKTHQTPRGPFHANHSITIAQVVNSWHQINFLVLTCQCILGLVWIPAQWFLVKIKKLLGKSPQRHQFPHLLPKQNMLRFWACRDKSTKDLIGLKSWKYSFL